MNGFSLVELSIVLVILGLLTGGILSGQSLIRAAELRAVSTEYQLHSTAVNSFKDKYFALPGDMTNATAFWGTDAGGCPGTNATATSTGVATCNGDGSSTVAPGSSSYGEMYRFWQQLSNAALIEGAFTGVTNAAASTTIANSTSTPNVPKSKMSNASWMIQYAGSKLVSNTTFFDGEYGHQFHYASGTTGFGAILKPEEAWNIDTKVDDGKPGMGKTRSLKNAAQANATTGCSDQAYTTAASIAATSSYLLSNTSVICSLVFSAGF